MAHIHNEQSRCTCQEIVDELARMKDEFYDKKNLQEMAPTIRVPVTHLHDEQQIAKIQMIIKSEENMINAFFDASSDPSNDMCGDEYLEPVEAFIEYGRVKCDFLSHYRHKTLSGESLSIFRNAQWKVLSLVIQNKSKTVGKVGIISFVGDEYDAKEYYTSAWEEQWVA